MRGVSCDFKEAIIWRAFSDDRNCRSRDCWRTAHPGAARDDGSKLAFDQHDDASEGSFNERFIVAVAPSRSGVRK